MRTDARVLEPQMAGGGRAWFVRTRHRWACGLKPVTREAHWLGGAYAAAIAGIAWPIAERDWEAGWLLGGGASVVFATFFYILIALRMSAPTPTGPRRR